MVSNKSDLQTILETLKEHEKRISSLEQKAGSNLKIKRNLITKPQLNNYSGPSGGIRFLLGKGFFKAKRDLTSVRSELNKNNYYYSRQAVDGVLGRLSQINGLLVCLKEKGRKVYVERK